MKECCVCGGSPRRRSGCWSCSRGRLRVRAALPYREGPSFQLEVTAEHPDFFEPLTASASGYAESGGELALAAAEELEHTLFSALLPALRGRGRALPELVLWGREHRFRASASQVVLLGGGELPGGRDLWSRIGEEILPYLGSKSAYWLKLYIARVGEEVSCEARLNGWAVPELTALLAEACGRAGPAERQAVRGLCSGGGDPGAVPLYLGGRLAADGGGYPVF